MSVLAMIALFPTTPTVPWVFLYIGPDVFLPLTSALAAVAGVVLMFWQRIVSFIGRALGRGPDGTTQPPPNESGNERG